MSLGPEDIYDGLMAGSVGDAFDAHLLASILALGAAEASADEIALTDAAGLDGGELLALVAENFPKAGGLLPLPVTAEFVVRDPDEACLVDLLQRCATARTVFQRRLAAMLARRAQRPNHLWQDLGLLERGELSRLMQRHFAPLARRNTRDMKWKKFLYRMICRDSGYALCTAPSCRECPDFDHCFGDESGESLLARARLRAETGP